MKPIYEPRGAAKEYGDLALNIYTGCPHRCFYCFAPSPVAAIIAAAAHWGETWNEDRFYDKCRPERVCA